ncbi:hypothetical protein NAEGRDRAFT_70870 [Naegleria gruberi]|uniref:F-box domain-containing protein n=1 Tax=Naegleria gruberi TaxID=5762 RepID=D2VPI3_NAEGR|nr:uncharacterized protein NAEGRDRAFT_70870 [Naegleria gruberi]EFC41214.1 hypothetical protein NAEGRDRAFT_70870 [Naegleria gruberi]|eukprot:XP_002673958.1 hypothetical protein NAEGRDRAFT_70870 [Naegleria gruberi strain NEG-M]
MLLMMIVLGGDVDDIANDCITRTNDEYCLLLFEDLPLEIRVHILWYCSGDSLQSLAQVNHFYNHLIFGGGGKSMNSDDEYSGYRNSLWKSKLKGLMNLWVDQINENITNHFVYTSMLDNFTENSLDSYIKKQLFKDGENNYRDLVKQLLEIKFKYQEEATCEKSDTGVTINGRYIRNNDIKDWNSFLCQNYYLTNRIEQVNGLFTFKGYEIVINEYFACQNSWRILFGIGIDFNTFNNDKSTTQYLRENKGFAYIVDSKRVKILGNHISDASNIIDTEIVKIGERFSLYINFEENLVYFFRNGVHVMTIESSMEDNVIYYPIIALCPKKAVTLYPLLSCNYILNPNAPKRGEKPRL